jgi:hypothetical protein
MCFQPHEPLLKRHQTFPKSPFFWFSKVHNWTLWISPKDLQPLAFMFLKSFLFSFHEILKLPNSVSDLVKSFHDWNLSCHNFTLVHSTILNVIQNLCSRAMIFAVTNLQIVDSKSCRDYISLIVSQFCWNTNIKLSQNSTDRNNSTSKHKQIWFNFKTYIQLYFLFLVEYIWFPVKNHFPKSIHSKS